MPTTASLRHLRHASADPAPGASLRAAATTPATDGSRRRALRPRRNRPVTVPRAWRESRRGGSIRSAIEAAKDQVAAEAGCASPPPATISASRARYRELCQARTSPAHTLSDASIPDLDTFPVLGRCQARRKPLRRARIAVEDDAEASAPLRRLATREDQSVDVAGSYRLTRTLDVGPPAFASLQERDRLCAARSIRASRTARPSTWGTQFRF